MAAVKLFCNHREKDTIPLSLEPPPADYVYEIYPILNGHKAVYEVDLYGKDDTAISYRRETEEGKVPTQRIKLDLKEIDKSTIYSLNLKSGHIL